MKQKQDGPITIETLPVVFHKMRLWTWKLSSEEDPGHGRHTNMVSSPVYAFF